MSDLHVGAVVVNVLDMARAAAFWKAALGYEPRDGRLDEEFTVLTGPGVSISLQLTDASPAGPSPVHLDLYTADQAGEVARLTAAGASRVEDWDYPEDPDFVVLRDPDGNHFCIIQKG